MGLPAAAAAVLFSVADPAGDALGDGSYVLPRGVEAAALDLRTFTAVNREGRLELRLALARLAPDPAPGGFAVPALEVFVGDGQGGEEALSPTGFRSAGGGWRYQLSVNGWRARLVPAPGAEPLEGPVSVRLEGTEVVVGTPIPASRNASYWAFVGLYDPLTPDGWKRPVASGGPLALVSPLPEPPAALDVLSPEPQLSIYTTRAVPSLGGGPDRSVWLLYTGLAGLVLALGATVLGLLRPRHRGALD